VAWSVCSNAATLARLSWRAPDATVLLPLEITAACDECSDVDAETKPVHLAHEVGEVGAQRRVRARPTALTRVASLATSPTSRARCTTAALSFGSGR
jgi:hypothetical protein